jgi:L-aspartate oxidase
MSNKDVLIVGAGLAGLFLALRLAPRSCRVVAMAPLGQAAASAWAQGGMAAALSPQDDPALHAADTLAAGAGLVDPVVAKLIATDGPARVRDLIALGVPFDRTADGELALSLEAAHSRARVARVAGDLAGKAIMEALTYAVQASSHIEVLEGVKAVALLHDANGRVTGVRAERGGEQIELLSPETVLCAGGSGGLYSVTTNPKSSRGEAIAMAWRAGAMVSDPEFVQFHPTAIDIGRDPAPLATEALRGEGAKLIDRNGRAFMKDYNPMAELAPRDEVARAIHAERLAGRGAFLDCRKAVGAHFPEHFPTVFEACMSAGVDPRTMPIPVAPAMHYHMGGVASDLWGRTTVEGLSVCGESASTGAHGANRLASNSLLEAVVFADRIARRFKGATFTAPTTAAVNGAWPQHADEAEVAQLRTRMHSLVGVARDRAGLTQMLDHVASRSGAVRASAPFVTARLIASCALNREESRGGHYRTDFPHAAPQAIRTYIRKGEGETIVACGSPFPARETA